MNQKKQLDELEAWRLYELIEELHDFLHQPKNYQKLEQLESWLASGVYDELHRIYYDVLAEWFPVDEESGEVPPPERAERRFGR
jgi:hypothetical protein